MTALRFAARADGSCEFFEQFVCRLSSLPGTIVNFLLIDRLLKLCIVGALFASPFLCMAAGAPIIPEHIRTDIPKAQLAGQGSYRWLGLKVYDAQFWVDDQGFQTSAPTSNRFALNLRYARLLEGKKIADSSLDEMKKLGRGSPEQHKVWLAKMQQIFPDVDDGTNITGIFIPNQGARFFLNGKFLGDVSDPEFGAAFFAIWLDPKTSAPGLRQALIVNAARQ